MNMRSKLGVVILGGALCATMAASQDKKIKRSDLPPAVEKTVAAESTGATIKSFSTEKENGETLYEAEMTVGGHSKDVTMNAQGEVVEVEEEVAMDNLPTAVKSGLLSKAGKGKITRVESLTKKGKLVAYEAQVNSNGKKSEAQVGPEGQPLDHKE
jgi:uncharacterized membrane protein YkoI